MGILYIYGTGGLGRETMELARGVNRVCGRWSDIRFINDFTDDRECMGAEIYTFEHALEVIGNKDEAVIAVGEPEARKKLYERVVNGGITPATVTYPGFEISESSVIGNGSIVNTGDIITVDVEIGENCVINKGVIVGHDARVGRNCVICPGVTVGGFADIGEGTFIGSGASVRDRIRIGKNCIVGMGAVVIRDIADNEVIVGNPADCLRINDGGGVFK